MKGQHEEAAHTAVGQEVEPGDHGGNRTPLSELYKTDRWVSSIRCNTAQILFLFCVLETKSHFKAMLIWNSLGAQASLELMKNLLPETPVCWNYRHEPPHLAKNYLFRRPQTHGLVTRTVYGPAVQGTR